MKSFNAPIDETPRLTIRNPKSSVYGDNAGELTPRHKILTVLVAVISSFAVGSIPVIYAFTAAPTHNQNTAQNTFPRGEMF